jgi:hypothetical protein
MSTWKKGDEGGMRDMASKVVLLNRFKGVH